MQRQRWWVHAHLVHLLPRWHFLGGSRERVHLSGTPRTVTLVSPRVGVTSGCSRSERCPEPTGLVIQRTGVPVPSPPSLPLLLLLLLLLLPLVPARQQLMCWSLPLQWQPLLLLDRRR